MKKGERLSLPPIRIDQVLLRPSCAHVRTAVIVIQKIVVPFGTQSANVDLNEGAAIGNGANLVVAHQYIIPAEREYVITFDVDLYQAGVYLATYNHEIEKTINFAKNGNYSLNVKLAPNTVDPDNGTLYPIEFTVNEIKDWDNGNVALNN